MRYKIYKSSKGDIIAVSSYAKKTVKGVAKCSPTDEYDEKFGEELAIARCDLKVCKKRRARARTKLAESAKEFNRAYKKYANMKEYEADAEDSYAVAKKKLDSLLTK